MPEIQLHHGLTGEVLRGIGKGKSPRVRIDIENTFNLTISLMQIELLRACDITHCVRAQTASILSLSESNITQRIQQLRRENRKLDLALSRQGGSDVLPQYVDLVKDLGLFDKEKIREIQRNYEQKFSSRRLK